MFRARARHPRRCRHRGWRLLRHRQNGSRSHDVPGSRYRRKPPTEGPRPWPKPEQTADEDDARSTTIVHGQADAYPPFGRRLSTPAVDERHVAVFRTADEPAARPPETLLQGAF